MGIIMAYDNMAWFNKVLISSYGGYFYNSIFFNNNIFAYIRGAKCKPDFLSILSIFVSLNWIKCLLSELSAS